MGDNFIGEIRMFAYNRIPQGWVICNGATLNIPQYAALYSLLGVAFGGDGKTTFGIPDIRGRVPLATSYVQPIIQQGAKAGSDTVLLTTANMPSHTHALLASPNPATSVSATNNTSVFAQCASTSTSRPVEKTYGAAVTGSIVAMNAGTCTNTGGNAHNNLQPSLGICFCIATSGIYPSRP